ncbi:peroxisomal coenzyme A diphosphatase NUDT7 [Gadus chalcogrammus]|uniref:peroxisomal coenzyme A diphosphatase NUDT7 n=1 Tax=Gadus chalcogrammus TaxID=1042646 RepID=UPI0024C4B926|nr:peroxisomal coenzyme A diphosphatase NUDT7 [Gadus chalcogrammus]
MDIKQRAIDNLKGQVGSESSEPPVRPKASVLIPLFVKNGELYVLLTLRSEQLRTNAGEVCFPGGKSDPQDTDEIHTALREAEEEIGIPPDQVEVVCRLLDPIVSKGGLLVTAVVGFIDGSFLPRPNPAEVSEVFAVPLKLFVQKKDHSMFGAPGMFLHSFQFLDSDSGRQYRIYGLTAAFAIIVAVLALGKWPEFDIDLGSGSFADRINSRINRTMSKL